jgi:FkbM family methyltransferase
MSEFSFEHQLVEVMKKDITALINEQKKTFEQLTAVTGETFILFGAGRLGQLTLAGLRKADVKPLAFTDNNPKLWNTSIEGLRVLSPQDAVNQFSQKAIFVITVYTSQPVWEQLTALGLKVLSFAALAWHYPQTLTPHGGVELPNKIFKHSETIREVLSLWADDTSRLEYVTQLAWRTTLNRSIQPPHLPQEAIYFPEDLISPMEDEVFVDCGAFDGDTVREFIQRRGVSFAQIVAVEPDPANCQALQARVANLPKETQDKIRVIQSAAGSQHVAVTFNATGTAGSSIGEGRYQVQSAPLDELVGQYRPTYIKMDIEGAEPDALLGMRQIIEKDAPVLAICLYHVQEHLWQIPLLIQSLSDQYSFYLRRYADECWEIVLYAVPKFRLR